MTEHLIVFPDRETAEDVAAGLREDGFDDVRVVREALAGRGPQAAGADDAEDHEWGVYVREEMVVDESRPVAQGLRDRFAALADERGGWYDPDPAG